ncbi:hypothetical protein LCGC14_2968940, partial [marine sediment metagenome]
ATGFLTSEDINNTLDYYLDLANQTRTQIADMIDAITTENATIGDIYDYLFNRDEWATQTNITEDIPFPPSNAVLTVDLSRSGLINLSSHDNVEAQHYTGDEPPENSLSTATNEFIKSYTTIAEIPSNMTNAYVRYWVQKVGSPTGSLSIYVNGLFIHNVTDVSTLSTDMTFQELWFDPNGNITDTLLLITFKGLDTWNVPNHLAFGFDHTVGLSTYSSPDDSTWAITVNEMVRGIELEFNQQSFSDQIGVDELINQSRDIENVTRKQIVEEGDAQFTDANTSRTRIETDLNNPSQYKNTTGVVAVIVEDKTGYSLTVQDWVTSGDLNQSLKDELNTTNQTLKQIISIGNADWTTGTGNDTGAVCVTVEDKS